MTLLIRHNSYVSAFPRVIWSCLLFKTYCKIANDSAVWSWELCSCPFLTCYLIWSILAVLLPILFHSGVNSTKPHVAVKWWYSRQRDSFCPSYSLSVSWEPLTSLRRNTIMRLLQMNKNVIYMQNGLANQQNSLPAGGSSWRTTEIITMLVGLINKENCINYFY